MQNRHRQPLPASLPGTLPDPAMQGASAQHMVVSMGDQLLTHTHTPHTRVFIETSAFMIYRCAYSEQPVFKNFGFEILMADRRIHFALADELIRTVTLQMGLTSHGTL